MGCDRIMAAVAVALKAGGVLLLWRVPVGSLGEHIGLVMLTVGLLGLFLAPLARRCTSVESAYAVGFAAGERKGRLMSRPVVVPIRRETRSDTAG